MKIHWTIRFLVLCAFFQATGYGGVFHSFSQADSSTSDTESELIPEGAVNSDGGSWLGVRGGAQMKNGSIKDRWGIFATYEYRFHDAFSIPVEVQILENENSGYGFLSLGGKVRIKIFEHSNVYGQGGLGIATPVLSPFHIQYSFGAEYVVTNTFSVSCNLKKTNYYPDLGYFLSIGANLRVSARPPAKP